MAKGSRKLKSERIRNVGGREQKSKKVRGKMQLKKRKIQLKKDSHEENDTEVLPGVFLSETK